LVQTIFKKVISTKNINFPLITAVHHCVATVKNAFFQDKLLGNFPGAIYFLTIFASFKEILSELNFFGRKTNYWYEQLADIFNIFFGELFG